MSAFHPNVKLPIWVALVIPGAAYVYRSVQRGFDFRPDLPLDALVLAMFIVLLSVVYLGRRARAQYERDEHHAEEDHGEDQGT